MQIYLDYSATTPPDDQVVATMQKMMIEAWGNPSSLHAWGERAATAVEIARYQVANLINAPTPESVVFTSGGTEADNFALMGVARKYSQPQHLIISSVEHSAVAGPAHLLQQQGWQVTRLPVNSQGRVNPADLQQAIQPNTALVSIIYGQSEVGTLQPIAELARITRVHGVLFHTDAVQIVGRMPVDVQQLGVDLLSLSGHKFYGPQGVGALYIRPGVEISPLMLGGGHEAGYRSGTPAVAAIAALGTAAELASGQLVTEAGRLTQLRLRLFNLLSDCPYLLPSGDPLHRLPHHVSFVLDSPPELPPLIDNATPVTGKTVVRQMNLAGIGISAGSACHSGKVTPSPVLLAMGYNQEAAKSGIRLTLGKHTTTADVDWTAMVLQQVIQRLSDHSTAFPVQT